MFPNKSVAEFKGGSACCKVCVLVCIGQYHLQEYYHKSYGGTVGLCWNDNYSTTHICKYLLMSKLYSEVAAYLPLFYRLLLSDVDCRVELRCHVVTRPSFGRER